MPRSATMQRVLLALILFLQLGPRASAQSIPIRAVGPILARSTENVGPAVTVRGTSDGHVIVAAGSRQRVYAFDSTLRLVATVIDSGSGSGMVRTAGLISYLGDSTLLPDYAANVLVVVDGGGKAVRSLAAPHTDDLIFLGSPSVYGRPGLDPKGRLIYRAPVRGNPRALESGDTQRSNRLRPSPDSSPILRGDFESRTVDTLTWMKTPTQERVSMEYKPNPSGGSSLTMKVLINPFQMADEWAVLSNGTVAVIRTHDYHIDWVDQDGTRRSTEKMPTDWRRYSDSERTSRVDSMLKIVRTQSQQSMAEINSMGSGNGSFRIDIGVVPDSEFPTFWPPVLSGAVLSDLDAHLWILPTSSSNATNGFTYDVVNRDGRLFERVQLPKGRVLVGFGPNDVIYMTHTVGDTTALERALAHPRSK